MILQKNNDIHCTLTSHVIVICFHHKHDVMGWLHVATLSITSQMKLCVRDRENRSLILIIEVKAGVYTYIII